MTNDVDNRILPILEALQADMAEVKNRLGRVEERVIETNAQLSAFQDMTEARFIGLEHAVLDVSARAYRSTARRDDPKS